MSVKRSRIVRSSSFGDTGMAPPLQTPTTTADSELLYRVPPSVAFSGASGAPNHPQHPECAAAKVEAGVQRPGILALSSPVTEERGGGEEAVGNFLERCYFCKKMFNAEEDIFMYGYLRAFCTSECRENQMIMDRIQEQSALKSSGSTSGSCWMSNRKD